MMTGLNDYRLVVTDSGFYGCGWYFRLPSHGWCFFELAVWYRGEHAWAL
jgi:hypothetical protein